MIPSEDFPSKMVRTTEFNPPDIEQEVLKQLKANQEAAEGELQNKRPRMAVLRALALHEATLMDILKEIWTHGGNTG